jgi:hypothetical protein
MRFAAIFFFVTFLTGFDSSDSPRRGEGWAEYCSRVPHRCEGYDKQLSNSLDKRAENIQEKCKGLKGDNYSRCYAAQTWHKQPHQTDSPKSNTPWYIQLPHEVSAQSSGVKGNLRVSGSSLECQIMREEIMRQINSGDICSKQWEICMRNAFDDYARINCNSTRAGCQLGNGLGAALNKENLDRQIQQYKFQCEK